MLIKDFFDDLKMGKVPIIIDDEHQRSLCQPYADEIYHYREFDFSSDHSGLLLTSRRDFITQDLKNIAVDNQSKIMLLPMAKHLFCHEYEQCIDYSLEKLMRTETDLCLQKIKQIESVVKNNSFLCMDNITLQIQSINQLSCPLEIKSGDLLSPYSIYEFALFQPPNITRFIVDGVFDFDQMLIAGFDENDENKKLKFDFIHHVHQSKKRFLRIKNNKVTSLIIDNREYVDVVDRLAGGCSVVEIAFGVNETMKENHNAYLNSPMNEGVTGSHIGVGTGKGNYHIDFISQRICFNQLIKDQKNER